MSPPHATAAVLTPKPWPALLAVGSEFVAVQAVPLYNTEVACLDPGEALLIPPKAKVVDSVSPHAIILSSWEG